MSLAAAQNGHRILFALRNKLSKLLKHLGQVLVPFLLKLCCFLIDHVERGPRRRLHAVSQQAR